MEKDLDFKKIILSLFGFVILWAIVTDAWGYSSYIFRNDASSIGKYIYGYISRIIWVTPAIFLIVKYNSKLKLNKSELFSALKLNKSLGLAIAISLIYIVIHMLIIHKGFWFNSNINLGLLCVKFVMVGFVEEVVFRGWGYNSLSNVLSHKKATIISTLFFILLHFPAYFIKLLRFGIFDFTGIIGQSIAVLIWGIVCCKLLKKGRSIWNPIVAHTIYDLMYVLLVGGA